MDMVDFRKALSLLPGRSARALVPWGPPAFGEEAAEVCGCAVDHVPRQSSPPRLAEVMQLDRRRISVPTRRPVPSWRSRQLTTGRSRGRYVRFYLPKAHL